MKRRHDDKFLGDAIAAVVILIALALIFVPLVFGVQWIN